MMALFCRFTIFSELPTELRNQIWRLTLRPRIIDIEFTDKKAVYTKAKLPTALHVLKESRAAVEKLYPSCQDLSAYGVRAFEYNGGYSTRCVHEKSLRLLNLSPMEE